LASFSTNAVSYRHNTTQHAIHVSFKPPLKRVPPSLSARARSSARARHVPVALHPQPRLTHSPSPRRRTTPTHSDHWSRTVAKAPIFTRDANPKHHPSVRHHIQRKHTLARDATARTTHFGAHATRDKTYRHFRLPSGRFRRRTRRERANLYTHARAHSSVPSSAQRRTIAPLCARKLRHRRRARTHRTLSHAKTHRNPRPRGRAHRETSKHRRRRVARASE
jgi:hypothetical protein